MDKSIRPVFTLELNYKIIPGLVTVGKYDGTHPCLTAATSTDKVLIHSPHRRNVSVHGRINYSESNREISTLNINQTITSIVAGIFIPDEDKDILVIGTISHILVYHVHDNRDIFFKECQDSVKALALGNFGESKNKILLVGGNSSIHGYGHDGVELFWTSVGDVITSMILMDFDKDSTEELIVSSEDFKIRILKWNNLVSESIETEVVTHLVCLPQNRFAYAVSNGTIGVYEQDTRLWRVKSKHFAVAMQSYDLMGQGSPQLITGWSNGKVDCRGIQTGEVFFKDTMNSSVAGVIEGDYRSNGKTDVIAISQDGEVRGYTTTKSLSITSAGGSDQDIVRELLAQKQALLMEFKHYENNNNYNNNSNNQLESFESQGVIPANTRLQIGIAANEGYSKERFIEIFVSTNNSTIIRSVTIFAEGIFKGETHVVHPADHQISSDLTIPLLLPNDNPVDIHIKAFVGYPKSEQYHVFEITRQLPRFSMYALGNISADEVPKSYVEFRINERLQRIAMWINQNFLLSNDVEIDGGPTLELNMKCLRDGSNLVMLFEVIGTVRIYTDNIALAADLVQSLAMFLNLESLEITRQLPRFFMYALGNISADEVLKSYVEFRINERLQRIAMWINQNFLLSNDVEIDGGPSLELNMKCLRDGSNLVMLFEVIGTVRIYTDNIALAADLVQSLAMFLNLESLESNVHFPQEEKQVSDLIMKLSEIQETRTRLGNDVADRLSQVRSLVIKAEDARLNDITEMSQHFNDLNNSNKELMNGYNIRLNNHLEGLETVKKINTIIQRASRLRVGQKSSQMLSHCRNAITKNNIEGLLKIIRIGEI